MRHGERLWARLPHGMRAPVATVFFLTTVTLAVALLVAASHRDAAATQVAEAVDGVVADLLAAGPDLLAAEGHDVLAAAVVDEPVLRAARVVDGTGGVVVEAGSWPNGVDGVHAEPFARTAGETLSIEVVPVAGALPLGWQAVALLWAVLAAGTLAIGFTLERGRRSRIVQLEETVRSLTARDAHVAVERQELLESKTGFVRAVSHELRTPLHVIRGVAQLLATKGEAVPPARREEMLRRLVANTERLDGLLQDLIDVDRLTSRTAHVARHDVDLAATVAAVLDGLDTGDHDVDVDVDGVVAHVTPGHVERILHHLLHNACKYAPAGTTVHVRARRDGERVELVVSDEGPGVPKADRLRLFEPLHRSGDDGPQPGLGLGLSLVRRFAELHGGRAWVDDAAAGGAAFHVTLPDEGQPVAIDDWDLASHVAHERQRVTSSVSPVPQ